jgi:D-3-phosphoglycerate dehydrogenase / 2-oxoglutarate reductase
MFKIQVLNKIAKAGLSQFPETLYSVSAEVQSPDAILVRSTSMHEMPIPTSVKVIGRAGAGVNNIPVAELTKRGIPVLNTPGANANAVSELVLAGMLMASRKLCEALDYARHVQGNDDAITAVIEENKKQFVGSELLGKTLGIIGLGNVGVKVANAAVHLGMRVIGYDPTISVNRAWELSANVIQCHAITELLEASDFVTIHVPFSAETNNMISVENLHHFKNNAVLLNFSRAGIVNNEDLFDALNSKKIAKYVCDFPSALLNNHPAVIYFPHLGASTHEAEENCAVMLAKQVRNYLEFGAIMHSVNFPQVEATQNYIGVRLAIVNANIPNMVAQITAKLAKAGLNIIDLVNKSRDEIAYTLLDVQDNISAETLSEIAKIDGVLQLRVINRI